MAKYEKYDDEDGVWRTVGGRRIFIRNGQSLSDAMKESGKFKKTNSGNVSKVDVARGKLELEGKKEDLKNYDKPEEYKGKLTYLAGKHGNKDQVMTKEETMEEVAKDVAKSFGAKSVKVNDKEIDLSDKKEQFEVSDLKKKAMETLPKEDIDSHEGDLYIKKTKESEALLNNMKDKDSGLLTTFKDQQTGETWYDIPFANMGDDYKEKEENPSEAQLKRTETEYKDVADLRDEYEDKVLSKMDGYNDKTTAKFGKIDYNGTGRKANEVEIEMELKDGVFTASGMIWNSKHTDGITGGQNIDEIADLMKNNKDVQEIHSLWKKYHLNDMHAGTEKQEEALEKYKGERKAIANEMNKDKKYDWQKVDENDYYVTRKLLENHNLLKDDGYEYGTGWLKREIPEEDKKRIIELIDKYNGKEEKTTNGTMNNILQQKAYQKYLKEHPNSEMKFEDFIKSRK